MNSFDEERLKGKLALKTGLRKNKFAKHTINLSQGKGHKLGTKNCLYSINRLVSVSHNPTRSHEVMLLELRRPLNFNHK